MIRDRKPSLSDGLGATSMSFWLRRWIVHSRSHKWLIAPKRLAKCRFEGVEERRFAGGDGRVAIDVEGGGGTLNGNYGVSN